MRTAGAQKNLCIAFALLWHEIAMRWPSPNLSVAVEQSGEERLGMSSAIPFYDAEQVKNSLDIAGGIKVVREAMMALSASGEAQPLRQILNLGDDRLFGIMPGHLPSSSRFGAKLVSVFPDSARSGRTRHRGIVVIFNLASGEPVCLADAESITTIRTACATAVATEALARHDADILAVYGTGLQAEAHVRALTRIRNFRSITIWGRSAVRARGLAAKLSSETGLAITGTGDGEAAARNASVICTLTSSVTPVLCGAWVEPGAHVNLVGSSLLGPVEVDTHLVAKGRYIADYKPSALAHAAELAVARADGRIGDDHVVGEIGEVLAGSLAGRQSAEQITIYKSLGHIVQDLAAATYVHERIRAKEGSSPS